MKLYTKLDCPLCNVIKVKMNNANIPYDISMNEKEMESLNIDKLPVLITDEGEQLEFKDILKYLEQYQQ